MFFIKEKGWGKKRKGKHAQKNPDGMEHNPHYSTEKETKPDLNSMGCFIINVK